MDLATTQKLSRLVPDEKTIVSESGIHYSKDLNNLASYGAKTFLVGESLMRNADLAEATQQLLSGNQ